MIDTTKQSHKPLGLPLSAPRSYHDIVSYLESHWSPVQTEKTFEKAKQLDKALGSPSQKIPVILVAGSNGKSLTIHYIAKLLREEGLSVGTLCAPHLLTYNERIAINQETISNKVFSEAANEVLNAAQLTHIEAGSHEIITLSALVTFINQAVNVAVLEVDEGGTFNAANICHAKIATITRVTPLNADQSEAQLLPVIRDVLGIVKKDTFVISGDQSKNSLQAMHDLTVEHKGQWVMPIRKLAGLPYPFEQLHGRCGALAERVAQLFMEKCSATTKQAAVPSLLVRQKAQRGRPTLEAKRHLELHPRRTVSQFWKEQTETIPGRFQLLDKEKPSILLDTADNIDALKNLLLGIRLLHYQRPLKGLSIVIGAAKETLYSEEFLKLIRYFFKKTSGQIFICPIRDIIPGTHENLSWDAELVSQELKALKVKSRACESFEEAFEHAKKGVDERNGLVVITGSPSIVSAYWKAKGIKKL